MDEGHRSHHLCANVGYGPCIASRQFCRMGFLNVNAQIPISQYKYGLALAATEILSILLPMLVMIQHPKSYVKESCPND
jgi:hypothetical protein